MCGGAVWPPCLASARRELPTSTTASLQVGVQAAVNRWRLQAARLRRMHASSTASWSDKQHDLALALPGVHKLMSLARLCQGERRVHLHLSRSSAHFILQPV